MHLIIIMAITSTPAYVRNEKEEKVSETALVQCPESRAAPAGRQMRALPYAGRAPLSAFRFPLSGGQHGGAFASAEPP